MKAALLESYRAARYEVQLPSGLVRLAVDMHCPQLEEWLRAAGHSSAVWLTAWNPQGEQQADSLNLAAQQQLERRIIVMGHPITHGTAVDPAGSWPPEPSLLVPGLPFGDAIRLATDFRQLAILWCGEDAVPRLVEPAQAAR